MVKSNKRLVKASIWTAAIPFLRSVYRWFTGFQGQGIYVGLWVPFILSFGTLGVAGGDQK